MSNDAVVKTENPFGSVVPRGSAVAGQMAVAAEREKQEVMAQILLAKQFPRDEVRSMDKIINACCRPSLAEGALYSYSRGGTEITGPSIRMAEAIARHWGNITYGIRELDNSNGESKIEAFAWDMENNVRSAKVFSVPHVRHTRDGQKKLTDPRDVYEMVANMGSRRLRASILAIIPGDVVDAAVKQVEVTLHSTVDVSEEGVVKMAEAFAKHGVTKAMLEKRCQRRLDTITGAQMVTLRKIYQSIKDGMSKPAEWFDMGGDEEVSTETNPLEGGTK